LALYKESMINKIEDDLAGRNQNWEELENFLENLVDAIYPVGSIYISTTNNNPGGWIGGSWEAFGAGRCLVGVDVAQSEFNATEKTGGSKTHTLTYAEMPGHNHIIYHPNPTGDITTDGTGQAEVSNTKNTWGAKMTSTTNAGGNQPHNNLQPYITVYMFKRVA